MIFLLVFSWCFSWFSPRFLRALRVSRGKLRPLCDLSSSWVFSAFAPRLPRLRVEWAPPLACREFPRPENIDISRCLCSAETPLPLRPFLTLGLLRVSSASPRLRVEWAPPLACREFPRPENIDMQSMPVLRALRALRSGNSAPSATCPYLGSSPRLLRVSASPRRMGPAAGLSGVSSPPRTSTSVDTCAPRKLRSLCDLSLPWVFSALSPRLRVSASNGPRRWPVGSFLAPRTSTSIDACAPR